MRARATVGADYVSVTTVIAVLVKVLPSRAGSDTSNEHIPASFPCRFNGKKLAVELEMGVSCSQHDDYRWLHCYYRRE